MKQGITIVQKLHMLPPLILAGVLAAFLPTDGSAVQWQNLTHTSRHDVAVEMESVRLNSAGRLVVWLRFTPRGEQQRRESSQEYGTPNYRLHLEYYEVDCGEKNALLQLIDVLGAGGKRVARLKGGGLAEAVIPGSVLEKATILLCPELEDTALDDDEAPEAVAAETAGPVSQSDDASQEDLLQRITAALQKTEADPSNHGAWVELGNSYYDADKYPQAIEAYGHALRLEPNDPDVLNDQGAMLRQVGEISRALKNFEKALAIDPRNLESLYNIGFVYAFDVQRTDTALEYWKRYLALDHSSEKAQQVESFVKRYTE